MLLQRLFDLNPLSAFTLAYQDVLFWNHAPSATVVASLVLWTVAALWLGHAVFRSYEPRFAETV
jgi:ABC-type polysaccharide/polyol phosphate export permease